MENPLTSSWDQSQVPRSVPAQCLIMNVFNKLYQFFPEPNLKDPWSSHGGFRQPGQPAIEGHVQLETRSEQSFKIDHATGSMAFLANRSNYLEVEEMQVFDFFCLKLRHWSVISVNLGHEVPRVKRTYGHTDTHSKMASAAMGIVGPNLSAAGTYTSGKAVSSSQEIAEDSVCSKSNPTS